MDDLEKELGPLDDLEDDNDSSDDHSSIGTQKSKLPLVNPICEGELYSTFIHCSASMLNLLKRD